MTAVAINVEKVYRALERLECLLDPTRIMRKTDAEAKSDRAEAQRAIEQALSGMPAFRDLKPYRFGSEDEQLACVADIAKHVFDYHISPVPDERLLRESFLPGTRYEDGIWVADGANVDASAILVPPVLVGQACRIGKAAVVGPYSCIRYAPVENNTYFLKAVKNLKLRCSPDSQT